MNMFIEQPKKVTIAIDNYYWCFTEKGIEPLIALDMAVRLVTTHPPSHEIIGVEGVLTD